MIASALRAAVKAGNKLSERLLDAIQGLGPTKRLASASSEFYPPGFAKILDPVQELFDIDVDLSKAPPIAARGFMETAELGQPEKDWEYLAAVRPQENRDLRVAFDSLCGKITDSNARLELEKSLTVVIGVLTGDLFETGAEFKRYFQEPEKIPLSTQTMLGPGILEFGYELNNTTEAGIKRVASYQREICRTAVLLALVEGNQKLQKPFDAGDLTWSDKALKYYYKNAKPHDWVFTDDFQERTIYIPLSYLPRPALRPLR